MNFWDKLASWHFFLHVLIENVTPKPKKSADFSSRQPEELPLQILQEWLSLHWPIGSFCYSQEKSLLSRGGKFYFNRSFAIFSRIFELAIVKFYFNRSFAVFPRIFKLAIVSWCLLPFVLKENASWKPWSSRKLCSFPVRNFINAFTNFPGIFEFALASWYLVYKKTRFENRDSLVSNSAPDRKNFPLLGWKV